MIFKYLIYKLFISSSIYVFDSYDGDSNIKVNFLEFGSAQMNSINFSGKMKAKMQLDFSGIELQLLDTPKLGVKITAGMLGVTNKIPDVVTSILLNATMKQIQRKLIDNKLYIPFTEEAIQQTEVVSF